MSTTKKAQEIPTDPLQIIQSISEEALAALSKKLAEHPQFAQNTLRQLVHVNFRLAMEASIAAEQHKELDTSPEVAFMDGMKFLLGALMSEDQQKTQALLSHMAEAWDAQVHIVSQTNYDDQLPNAT
jgi:hypothetical protein